MKILSTQLVALTLLLTACGATSTNIDATAPATTQLFNGHSLAGWTVEAGEDATSTDGIFTVRDEQLICSGTPTAVLRTTGDYSNYELVLEWRWAPNTEGGNSGLLLHCSTPRARGIWPRCIESQLKSGSAAGFYLMGEGVALEIGGDTSRRNGSWIARSAGSERPIGEWNEMRVVCAGDTITVFLNGELANEGYASSETHGAIALQSEGAEVHFRRVDLMPLAN